MKEKNNFYFYCPECKIVTFKDLKKCYNCDMTINKKCLCDEKALNRLKKKLSEEKQNDKSRNKSNK